MAESANYELVVMPGADAPVETGQAEKRSMNSAVWSSQMAAIFGGVTSNSGRQVTTHSALTYSPIWAGVDMLSNDVAKLPMQTWVWNDSFTARSLDRNHPTWERFRRRTGEGLTANSWKGMMMAQAVLHGRAHSVVHRTGPRDFWLEFLRAHQVMPDRMNGERIYRITRDRHNANELPTSEIKFEAEMFNINGLTLDHWGGLSLVGFARNMIGRYLSTEDYTDDFFANDGVPSGVVTFPDSLDDDELERFAAVWERIHTGQGNRHRMLPLDKGATWARTAVSPHDAMLIDLLKFGPQDVARFLRIPGYKLGVETNVSYSSNEAEQRDYLNDTLMAWLVKFEDEAYEKCLFDNERRNERIEIVFNLAELTRADFKSQIEGNSLAIQSGQKNPNEARQEIKLPPYKEGDNFYIPANLMPANQARRPIEAPAAREDTVVTALREQLLRAMTRMVKRCARGLVRNGANLQTLMNHINSWPEKHRSTVIETMQDQADVWRSIEVELDGEEMADRLLAICERVALELYDYDRNFGGYTTHVATELSGLIKDLTNEN